MTPKAVVPAAAAAVALAAWLAGASAAEACSGCGCRGGPGYRGPDGRCVGWADIGRTCGSPPALRCRAEGPNAGAEEAAEHGVKALRARRPRGAPSATEP